MEWTDCPIVEVDPNKQDGVPLIRGTRVPVSAILNNHKSGLSDHWIAENFDLSIQQVRTILDFEKQVCSKKILVS